ncbi:MAG: ATP-binding protein [Eubacteriaceae bacterium]|nr:ATP-binding protein [Eubacteriaceae bacterium]
MERTDCTPVDCSTCNEDCGSRQDMESPILKAHPWSNIKKVIAIAGGKGGIGRSFITATLAVLLKAKGYQVGILDADIMGPVIPQAFGITEKAKGSDKGIYPVKTSDGIDVFSMSLLQKTDEEPALVNGAMASNILGQFWAQVIWGDKDFILIDLPSGTGDLPQTILERFPLNAVICVTSTPKLTQMVTEKSLKMIEDTEIPLLALVNNRSVKGEDLLRNRKADSEIPFSPKNETLMNQGRASEIILKELEPTIDKIINML